MAISLDPPSIGPQLDANLEKIRQRIRKALDNVAQQLSDNILEAGRSDISGAGNFGARWTSGFTSEIGGDGNVRTVTLRQAVPYWKVFQYGAIIQGKPLLWIPTTKGGPRAREYGGRLFRVPKKGKSRPGGGVPLLLDWDTKQVMYTGHETVTIPKKFHLIEIARAEAKTVGALFRVEMAGD